LQAIGPQEWRARAHRGGLAEVDAVETGEQIDDLPPDAARFDADAGVMAVDGRRFRQALRRLADHAHGAAGEALTEHHAGGAGFYHRMHRVEDFVRRTADVRSEG